MNGYLSHGRRRRARAPWWCPLLALALALAGLWVIVLFAALELWRWLA